jgi:hypothetical protein
MTYRKILLVGEADFASDCTLTVLLRFYPALEADLLASTLN